jgi:hypothetical protein
MRALLARLVLGAAMLATALTFSAPGLAQDPPAPARAEVRPRALVALGGGWLGRQTDYLTYRWDGDAWSSGEPTESQLAGRFLLTLGVGAGVQTDWFGAYVVSRTGFANADGAQSIVQHFALIAEVTLFDLVQIGVGPSLDILGHGVASGHDTDLYVGPDRPRESPRVVEPGGTVDWDVAPGFEARLGFATGGGPDERRGFFVTPVLHLSFPEGGFSAMGAIELGLQTF